MVTIFFFFLKIGVCGVSTSPLGVRIDFDDDDDDAEGISGGGVGGDAANEMANGGPGHSERMTGGGNGHGVHSVNILSGLGDDQSCGGPMDDNANGPSAYFSRGSGGGSIDGSATGVGITGGVGGKGRHTDAVSLDATSNNLVLVGNPSIGKSLILLSLFVLHFLMLNR